MAKGDFAEAEALLRRAEAAFRWLKDERHTAVTLGKIADILVSRGDLDEALRIHGGEILPVVERLGDVKGRAVTMGKIADILEARGDLDDALRIHETEFRPLVGLIHILLRTSGIRTAKGIGDQELLIVCWATCRKPINWRSV